MIEVKNLTHKFENTQTILADVNLALRRGETFVMVGPSGQGKSTLLKILSGLIAPTKGQVFIGDADLYACGKKQRADLMNKIGMLFQKNALFDSLTVGENLAFPLREVGHLAERQISQKVDEFLEAVGLEGKRHVFPSEISGGQQKRVGIARALILNPEIILYDDPTAGLDPITSRMIVELIIKLNKEFKATSVAITNDMNRAYQFADRIGLLMDHQLTLTGTVEETKKHKDPRVQKFIRGEFSLKDLEEEN